MSSDLTFITNEQGQHLGARFGVLLGDDTRLFDCLVGYFFISGFHKLHPALTNTEKIRILIGIKTDGATYELIQTAKKQQEFVLESHAQVRERVPGEILGELQKSGDSSEIEGGVRKFVEWIRSGKLEVRAYPSERVHAKLYIMTFHEGDRDKGRVITGSSNFTEAGLQDNLEFNVELKNRSDYEFALQKFNELWAKSVDVTKDYVTTIEVKSPFAQFTPYELYLKFLYEYFRGELNLPDEIEDMYLPIGFKKLKYQEEAVLNARKVLDEYGGAFLSDVVGLGKTFMSALLAQQLNEPCLVIAPPHLLDEHNPGSWPNVFREFGVRGYLCESLGKLDSLLDRDLDKFKTVFIDESHRFRTEDTQSYEMLAQICRGKRVVLVSATPLNNTPQDILSQIKLFQPGKNSTIPNVRNLEAFFGKMQQKLKGLDRQRDREQYFKIVRENALETREKILKFLMIRRTRTEIDKYYGEDLKRQGLKFASAMKAGNYCCISYARDEELFDGPKIVSPQRSDKNTFCFNDVPWYASADVYYITPKDPSVSLKYVLALIISRLYFLWLYFRGKRKGEMLELYLKPLSEIPIKRISPDEQKPFIKLVDRILAAKQRDAEADTSALAWEIDELVYALYGLTPEEKALVQAAAK